MKRSKRPAKHHRERPPQHQQNTVDVHVQSLVSLENRCTGCVRGQKCCCSSYEVCVTTAEMKRIIKFLPEAAKYCPHLLSSGGYDNVFEEEEPGLYSIDTTGEGLCLFAYWAHGRTRCSLHSAAVTLGLPLEQVKPKVCLLWPLHFSDGSEVLAMIDDAFQFACNSRNAPGSRGLSPGFIEAIDLVYGEGCGMQVHQAAQNGERHTLLAIRR